MLNPINRMHHLQDELNEKLADKCFVNFSLFQSLPDAWDRPDLPDHAIEWAGSGANPSWCDHGYHL